MSLPLSYPALRCVLEHLEAVKRAHIIGRSPGLQKIEKLIPLSLESFHIRNNKVIINRFCIKCEIDKVKFEMNLKTYSRKELANQEDKMKKIINFYIRGRSIINVDKLYLGHCSFPDIESLNMKFRVNSLNAIFLETAIPLIDPRSFPLKTVGTIPESSIFDNYIATSAETLILHPCSGVVVTLDNLKKLNNKKVVFERFSHSRFDMIPLIKYHIETKKDFKTTFVISTGTKIFIREMLSEFELAFREFRCDLDGVNERFVPGLPKFSIPINNRSRIQVFAIEDPGEGPYKIIVKPVPEVFRL